MFKIAICDDEKSICEEIENIISDYKAQFKDELETEIFYSGNELCGHMSAGNYYDLIFLDIEMQRLNGVEAGRKIRGDMDNQITQIVYISANQKYAMELFENRPLNFLIKPLDSGKVIATLKKALELMEKGNSTFEFSVGKDFCKLPYQNILYFQSNNKKIKIITVNQTYECYGKLTKIVQVAPKDNFLLIHKSYLINFLHVAEVQYDSMKLTNGEIMPISQTYRKQVRETLVGRRRIGGEL